MGHFKSLEAQPEDVFREAARLLDFFLSQEGISQKTMDGLWTLLINDIRVWKPDAHDDDKMLMAGTVFLIVKKILCHHADGYFCDTIHDMLDDTLERELKISDKEEHQQFLHRLSECSELLSTWINEYDDSEVCLSDEIEEALAAKQPKKKEEKKFIPIGQTFTKSVQITDVQLRIIGQRLTLAKKLDSSCSAENWEKLFSGVDSRFTINWLGHPGELRDLFDMLTKKRDGSNDGYLSPRYGYQKIVQSHFTDKNGEYFTDLRKQKSIEAFKPIIDDCEFFIQNYTEQLTDVMKQIIEEHWSELKEFGYVFDTSTYKREGMKISNRRH